MTVRTFSPTDAIGHLIAEASLDIEDTLVDRAVAAFTDTIGVALAGAAEPSAELAQRVALAQFASVGAPSTVVVGPGERLSACGASFVNAIAAHALDYDDVCTSVEGHPSALLVPVLLALAENIGATGRDVLEAYLVGLHVSSSVGAGFDLRAAYARGWHTTSVLGALGAAAAVARLRRLDPDQARMAIGIAGSVAAGSRASFGTMVKPLHVGMTAVEAILAVDLAQAGYSANPNIVEAPFGFLALHAESMIDPTAIERALARPVGLAVTELDVKRYPCCYHTHRMIDAALALRARLLADGSAVDLPAGLESVRITTAPGGTAALLYHWPTTPTEAKFSAEYAVSTALVDGAISGTTFEEPVLDRAAVRALMKRVEVVEQEVPPIGPRAWEDSFAVVEVLRRDGCRVAERVDVPKGGHRNRLTAAELGEKFQACAAQHPSRAVDSARALGLVSALRHDEDAGSLLRRILSSPESR
jgi:2-methylcitrate dehydratase PrpD